MKSKHQALKRKADTLFSQAVRLRDSDKDGFGNCITCEKRIHWKQAHAGHFIKRRYSATRYDEMNVNLQCSACNTFNHGEEYKYSRALDFKYGDGTAESLFKKAQQTYKLTIAELEEIIHDSKEQIKFYLEHL